MSVVVIVFVVAVAASLVAHVAILASVVRRATSVADPNVPRPRLGAEIAWAVIPLLALAIVFTATWTRVREHAVSPPAVMRIAK